ncbi:MAG: hypothetical protein ABSE73_14635 [Planctomycetota bacterium]
MVRMIDEQLGRVLLVVALLAVVVAAGLNPRQERPKVSEDRRPVQVPLDKASLTANSSEVFYIADNGNQFTAGVCIFVKPAKVIVYEPVPLSLPSGSVMRPPQILPDPGPALEGTIKLPRYGDEFPPVAPPVAPDKAAANPAAPGPAQPTTLKPGPAGPAPDTKVPLKPGPGVPAPDAKVPPKTAPGGAPDIKTPPKADLPGRGGAPAAEAKAR